MIETMLKFASDIRCLVLDMETTKVIKTVAIIIISGFAVTTQVDL